MQALSYIAEFFVVTGIASALIIAVDLQQHHQPMRIMKSVWILTGLWASVFGLWAYFAWGRHTPEPVDHPRAKHTDGMAGMPGMGSGEMGTLPEIDSRPMSGMPDMGCGQMPGMTTRSSTASTDNMHMPSRPRWQSITLSTLHCGAGCTLADLIGEWLLWFMPIAIGGSLVAGSWVVDYILALAIGIGFQYAAIREMEPQAAPGKVVARAAKADLLSLTAWQVGMFGWMAIVIFGFNGGEIPARDTAYFWFMMQIAMGCGFIISLPVNAWLIHRGIKHGM